MLIDLLKDSATANKMFYFSDRASSQYKHFKNFANLVCHRSDFWLKVAFLCHIPWQVWCGRHHLKRSSKKLSPSNNFRTHSDTTWFVWMGHWECQKCQPFFHIKLCPITCCWTENVILHAQKCTWYWRIPPLHPYRGWQKQSARCLVTSQLTVQIFTTEAAVKILASHNHTPDGSDASLTLDLCFIGGHVGCMYDKYLIGVICDESGMESDILMCTNYLADLMCTHYLSYQWPPKDDIFWVPLHCVIALLSIPTMVSGRQQHLDFKDQDRLQSALRTETEIKWVTFLLLYQDLNI